MRGSKEKAGQERSKEAEGAAEDGIREDEDEGHQRWLRLVFAFHIDAARRLCTPAAFLA